MNEELMIRLGFGKEVNRVREGICPTCNKPAEAEGFHDEPSKTEFGISGMCQKCQDSFKHK